MDKVLGGILGLCAFAAVVIAGVAGGIAPVGVLCRAVLAGAIGFLVGWIVFGKIGLALAKESAGPVEEKEKTR